MRLSHRYENLMHQDTKSASGSTNTTGEIKMTKRSVTSLVISTMLIGTMFVSVSVAAASKAPVQKPGVLTIASPVPPVSLNPALNGGNDPDDLYNELDYSSLIYLQENGTFAPGLATSWGFVGTGNTLFQIKLRPNVKFSDGSAVTAQAVKDSLEYFAKAGGPLASFATFKSITVTGKLSLLIRLNAPNIDLPLSLDQSESVGDIMSPKALAHPATLGTTSDGTGQYVLDAGATVSGETYTFTPNKKYWDTSAIKWKKIVVDVITDSTATLDALISGKVDYAFGVPQTASAASASGFKVEKKPSLLDFVEVLDRDGASVPALANPLVRQALSYAIDRPALVKALYGSDGSANDEIRLPGQPGYVKSLANYYAYDPAKAKALLTQAGYPNGFTLPMIAYDFSPGQVTAAEAIAAEWEAIGVTVDITTPATVTAAIEDLTGNTSVNATFNYFYEANPFGTDITNLTGDTLFNPYKVPDDSTTAALLAKVETSTNAKTQNTLYDQIETRWVTQLNWVIVYGDQDELTYVRPGLDGTKGTASDYNPDPIFFSASS
jgi:peptide/nickel transport system substrate-binding protein